MVITRSQAELIRERNYEELFNQIRIDFPKACFDICLGLNNVDDYNKMMDEKFTDENTIIVKDDRANEWSYYWSEWPRDKLAQFVNYTVVNRVDNKPITLRQVFKAMEADPHYSLESSRQDNHCFIEVIEWNTPIQISFFWGS